MVGDKTNSYHSDNITKKKLIINLSSILYTTFEKQIKLSKN